MNLFNIVHYINGKIIPGFKIKNSDFVVDVGSGDKPFWRADVFLDHLKLTNSQRFTSNDTVTRYGTFIDANAEKMPFNNKAFEFSYCSHLLEHVNRPDLVIQELTRISKRGYIEIPSGTIETLNPYSSHLWLIYLDKNILIFIRKSDLMYKAFSHNAIKYAVLNNRIRDPFIKFYWNKSIKYKIYRNPNKKYDYKETSTNKDNTVCRQTPYLLAFKIIRGLFYKKKDYKINSFLNK